MLESGCQGAFSYSFEIHSGCSSFCLSSIYIICFLQSGWLAFLSLFLFFLLFLLISHSSLKPVIAVGSRWVVSVLCHCVLLSSYLTGTGLWEVWERIEELLPCPKQHLISCERSFLIIHFLGCLSPPCFGWCHVIQNTSSVLDEIVCTASPADQWLSTLWVIIIILN